MFNVVEVIIDDKFFQIIVLGSSEGNKSVSFKSITAAPTTLIKFLTEARLVCYFL